MPLPLIVAPIIYSAAALGVTYILTKSGGGRATGEYETKKEMEGTEIHAPYERYQYSPSYQYDITDVHDVGGDVDIKKEMTQAPSTYLGGESGFRQVDYAPGAGAAGAGGAAVGEDPTAIGGGTDLIMLAIIGGAAWVAYGYVSD